MILSENSGTKTTYAHKIPHDIKGYNKGYIILFTGKGLNDS